MKLKPKHLEFVLHYLGTKDPGAAYSMVYPNASVQSLSAAASRIMARPEVRDYIEFTERRMEDRLLTQIEAEQEAKKQQLLSINEKRAVLTKIITGETKRVRFIKAKYGPQKVEEDLPVYAVLRAVDMDTRLETFYNILLHRHDWSTQQSRTTYINTPTLQQQVNILISQTTQEQNQNSNPDSYREQIPDFKEQNICPPLAGVSVNTDGGGTLAQEKTHKQILSHSINYPPLQLNQQEDEMSLPGACPVELREGKGGSLAPDSNRENSLTPMKKNINQLTKVNKNEKPVYNTTTKSTTNKKAPSLGERAGGEAPIPTIDYNPYTFEPLDPNINYNTYTYPNDPTIEPYTAPTQGKITVKPSIREYD